MSAEVALRAARHAGDRPALRVVLLGVAAILVGSVVAYLVAAGYWYLALAMMLAAPLLVAVHRYPLVTISIWLFLAPLVAVTYDVGNRKVFWIIHRSLPVVTLGAIAVGSILHLSDRKISRLGWAELLMGGYLMASVVSILYTSDAPLATAYFLYDRVFIPMCLYLIVRLLSPDERDLRMLLPAVAFLLVSQSLFGLLSWIEPGALPEAWLPLAGERTTGSLRDPNLYSVTVLFAGLFLLHRALTGGHSRRARFAAVALFLLALAMVFFTFSRAAWIAGLLALMMVALADPRFARRCLVVVVPVLLLILASGALTEPLGYAYDRLTSEDSALSRLPPLVAGARMFAAKPVAGWGYESFDRYSRRFQGRVGNLASAEKPHASHNLFVTILAEQGLIGFLLFLGPPAYWLARTVKRWRSIPRSGGIDRKLLLLLWAAVGAFIIVNNFVVVRVTFGPGVYWLTLGLIGSVVARFGQTREPGQSRLATGGV